jgi:hypothetical protein
MTRRSDQLSRIEASLARIEVALRSHAGAAREEYAALSASVRAAMSSADAALEAAGRASAATGNLGGKLDLVLRAVTPAVPGTEAQAVSISAPPPQTAPGGSTGEGSARRSRTAPSAKQESDG